MSGPIIEINAKMISPKKTHEDGRWVGKFTINYLEEYDGLYRLEQFPEDLEVDKLYIITNWNSNHIIEAQSNNTFIIKESYGEKLKCGKEYILNAPKY